MAVHLLAHQTEIWPFIAYRRILSSALGCALIDKDDVRNGLQPLMSERPSTLGGSDADISPMDLATSPVANGPRMDPDMLNGISYDIM